jgi:hypothetical protein
MSPDDRTSRDHEFITTGPWDGRTRAFWVRRIVFMVAGDREDQRLIDSVVYDLKKLASEEQIQEIRGNDPRFVELVFEEDIDVIAVAHRFEDDERVKFAEPVFAVYACGVAEPDDPDYKEGKQATLDLIRAEEGWELLRAIDTEAPIGSENVIVAVMDTGFPMSGSGVKNHEDFQSDRFDIKKDTYNEVILEQTGAAASLPDHRDDNGHGTNVLGIVAADTDNDIGIAGLNWSSNVYSYRVMVSTFPSATATTAVKRAVEDFLVELKAVMDSDDGAPRMGVVNLSLGADDNSTFEAMCDEIVHYRDEYGLRVILCCAVGNTDDDVGRVLYPAAYSVSEAYGDFVIAVGAVDESKALLETSVTGDEVTVVAPGWGIWTAGKTPDADKDEDDRPFADYEWAGKTSMATPHVAGLASLIWSMNPCLSTAEVKRCIIDTAEPLDTEASVPSSEWGYGLIDCHDAIVMATASVNLLTPSISFDAVPVGETQTQYVWFEVKSQLDIEFEVKSVALDTGDPSEFGGIGEVHRFSAADVSGGAEVSIPLRFTATDTNVIAAGIVTICQGSCTHTVNVYATTEAMPASLLVLTLDRSGSMGQPSGITGENRMQVLQWSAEILLDVMLSDCAVGLVTFSTDASDYLADNEYTSVLTLSDANRDAVRALILGLGYGGSTSIGDGVEKANEIIAASAGFTNTAIMVFSDGHENEPQTIAEVLPDIEFPVYAVAAGDDSTANQEALRDLTGTTGGYTLFLGALDDDNEYRLAKMFLQVLANATGENVALDPVGRIAPGHVDVIPFKVTGQDQRVDVILMMPGISGDEPLIDLALLNPTGKLIRPADVSGIEDIEFSTGERVSFFRFNPADEDELLRPGRWEALVTITGQNMATYLSESGGGDDREIALGVQYSLVVQVRSNVLMRCRSYLDALATEFTLRAVLSEAGVPLGTRPVVSARIAYPDGSERTVDLREIAPGMFEHTETTRVNGLFDVMIKARGSTTAGAEFTREQAVTVYKTPAVPGPPGRPSLP